MLAVVETSPMGGPQTPQPLESGVHLPAQKVNGAIDVRMKIPRRQSFPEKVRAQPVSDNELEFKLR